MEVGLFLFLNTLTHLPLSFLHLSKCFYSAIPFLYLPHTVLLTLGKIILPGLSRALMLLKRIIVYSSIASSVCLHAVDCMHTTYSCCLCCMSVCYWMHVPRCWSHTWLSLALWMHTTFLVYRLHTSLFLSLFCVTLPHLEGCSSVKSLFLFVLLWGTAMCTCCVLRLEHCPYMWLLFVIFPLFTSKVKRAPSNAEACMGRLFMLGFMVWVDEGDWPGFLLKEQVPPRYALGWLDLESRALTITLWELLPTYIYLVWKGHL